MRSAKTYGEITKHILHIRMPTLYAMNQAFRRIQERSEHINPEFHKRPFTLGELRQWYCSHEQALDNYDDKVCGMNFPSRVLVDFHLGLFDPLSPGEQEFLTAVRPRSDNFYVIVTGDDDTVSLDHEVCHGLFNTEPEYNKEVKKVLKTLPTKLIKEMEAELAYTYCSDVWEDEIHAYLATGYRDFFGNKLKVPAKHVQALVTIKDKWFKKLKINVEKISAGDYP